MFDDIIDIILISCAFLIHDPFCWVLMQNDADQKIFGVQSVRIFIVYDDS